MNRREHLKQSAALAAGLCAGPTWWSAASSKVASRETVSRDAAGEAPAIRLPAEGQVMTVTGPIAPEQMGTALPHEHVASRFGAAPERRPSYDVAALFEAVVPALRRLRALGCDTVACATTAYFGRDPLILKQLSERTGVQLLTNTGYYGAAADRYVPDHAYEESADALAARWLAEWRGGVDGTGIRPGFIKTAVDGPSGGQALSDIDRKLVRAAARTHLESGLTIAVHTGGNVAGAQEQLAVLKEEGVAAKAWIWVHAQEARGDLAALTQAAEQGAWIEFDNIEAGTVEEHLRLVRAMQQRGLLGRVLLSHDGNTFPIEGSAPRLYNALFTDFIPRLREASFSEAEVRRLTVENPRRALTVRVRS